MNENQNYQSVNKQATQSKTGQTEKSAFFGNFFFALFAFASLAILVITVIVLNFRPNHMNVIRGIMSIPVYILPVVGMALSFLQTKGKKPPFEFWLNFGALIVALRFL